MSPNLSAERLSDSTKVSDGVSAAPARPPEHAPESREGAPSGQAVGNAPSGHVVGNKSGDRQLELPIT
ncbi:hypothetical protein GCM10027063_39140 [Promicromonospora xylanilytica]